MLDKHRDVCHFMRVSWHGKHGDVLFLALTTGNVVVSSGML
jgi:hypothetical protein